MKVLIIGSSGFVGSYLYSFFSSIDADVFSCSRKGCDYNVDFCNPVVYGDVFGSVRFDLVICCINSYSTDMLTSIQSNVLAVQNVLECFSNEESHLVIVSSISALPENANNTAYNTSKRMAECIIEYHQKRDKHQITTIRFSQLFDIEGRARGSQAGLYYYVDMINARKPINYYAKNDTKRSFFPVYRIGDIVMLVYNKHITGFHNIILNDSFTNGELLDLLTSNCDYDKSLICRNNDKEAISYHIPSPSDKFDEIIMGINVKNELKKLIN